MELGVRIGELSSSTLVARPLGIVEHLIVATPKYPAHAAARRPGPGALQLHRLQEGRPKGAPLGLQIGAKGARSLAFRQPSGLNSADAMCSAVLLAMWASRSCRRGSSATTSAAGSGLCCPIFTDARCQINIVYPQTRVLSARARCFIDFLLAGMQGGPGSHR